MELSKFGTWVAIAVGVLAVMRELVRGLIALGRLAALVRDLEHTLERLDERVGHLEVTVGMRAASGRRPDGSDQGIIG